MALAKFYKQCSKNVAGNMAMFLTEISNVLSVTIGTNGEVLGILMDTGAEFLQIESDTSSIQRTQTGIRTNKTFVNYEHNINFRCSKARIEINDLSNALNDASPCGVLAIVVDGNGQCWLSGYNDSDLFRRPLFIEAEDFDSTDNPGTEGGTTGYQLKSVSSGLDLPFESASNTYILGEIRAAMGTGIPVGLDFAGHPGFETEYQTVYDTFTTKPASSIALAQNAMVKSMVDGGVWTKLDVFYVMAQTTNGGGEALKNWVNPGTWELEATVAPTFTALEGFTGNGSSMYMTLGGGYTLQSSARWLLNTCGMAVYNRTAGALAYLVGGTNIMFQGTSSENVRVRLNDATNDQIALGTKLGTLVGSREGAAIKRAYRHTTQAFDAITPPVALGNAVNLMSRGPADFYNGQLSLFLLGGAFTATEAGVIANAWETYMVSNGKGVV